MRGPRLVIALAGKGRSMPKPELPNPGDGGGAPRPAIRRRAITWLALLLILAFSAALRLYGLEWDEGHWLHPDERQIYFVALDLGWPSNLSQALSPESPLNPGFFAYGSLPLYLLRAFATLLAPFWPALRDPDNLHLAGRLLATLFDLGTIYLTYRLGLKLVSRGAGSGPEKALSGLLPLLAAGLVGTSVLHVQLAHFYTVDILLVFLVMLALTLAADVALGTGRARQAGLGLVLGLALATKVSAAPLLLVVPLAFYASPSPRDPRRARTAHRIAFTLALAAATFFLVQPYALLDWRTFVAHTLRESRIAWGRLEVPYTLQYNGTVPYLYPAWQTALWALALPVGLAGWAGLAYLLIRWLRRGTWADSLLLAWAGPYFALTGLLYAKPLRYMLPLVPVLCLASTHLLTRAAAWVGRRFGSSGAPHQAEARWPMALGTGVLLACGLIYALAFERIYAQPHPWVAASEWIYEYVPPASALAIEHWDTPLPLPMDVEGRARRCEEYDLHVLTLYDEPARYHELLFADQLGFALEAEFVRGPAWLNPRVPALPGAGPAWLRPDESFVVYDHPRALIFRNVSRLPAQELLRRLGFPLSIGTAPGPLASNGD
jgi:hypothetical protein